MLLFCTVLERQVYRLSSAQQRKTSSLLQTADTALDETLETVSVSLVSCGCKHHVAKIVDRGLDLVDRG